MQLHKPVFPVEVLSQVQGLSSFDTCLDGTFGRGGHTDMFLKNSSVKVVALDCDEEAISFGQKEFEKEIKEKRLYFFHNNFHDWSHIQEDIAEKTGVSLFDGILLDLGISSPQLDSPERGFSFYHEGPLDMRMDQRQKEKAASIVNEWSEEELLQLFKEKGEVRNPYPVVKAIIKNRKEKKYENTKELATMIEKVEGWRKKNHHPATKFFLALRLEVNKELEPLEESIVDLCQSLSEGGKIMVITFHSLEDRIVKQTFRSMEDKGLGHRVNKKVISPTEEELKSNSRSRSAKLRVFQWGVIRKKRKKYDEK